MGVNTNSAMFATEQDTDPSLESVKKAVCSNAPNKESSGELFMQENENRHLGEPYRQLVVSRWYHAVIVRLVHDCPFAGHLGRKKLL